jgi:ribosomal protein L16 Arg81 hydroxylase
MIEVHATSKHFLGMPAAEFLRDYWQKKPAADPQRLPRLTRPRCMPDDLAGLACEDGVLARLIEPRRAPAAAGDVRHRPIRRKEDFPGLPDHDWTLLVQDVDKWDAGRAPRCWSSFRLPAALAHRRRDGQLRCHRRLGRRACRPLRRIPAAGATAIAAGRSTPAWRMGQPAGPVSSDDVAN